MQPALGDVSCDLRDVETANLTEGWLEVLARTYTFGFAVRAFPASGETFSARTLRWPLGSSALVHTVHDRGDGRRGPAQIAANDPDLVGLLYMRRGTLGLDFEGQRVALGPGELVMWDTARRGAFAAFGRVDNQTLVVPRECLAMVAPGYEAMYGRPFRSDHPAARLMGSFLGSLMPVVSGLDVVARDAVADAALDIARAVVATRNDPRPRQQTATRLIAVRLYIDANLSNPRLSPTTIAKANAISLRTLHRLFESTDDSVSAVIRERRLSRCRADLLRGTDDSVSAIAFRWASATPRPSAACSVSATACLRASCKWPHAQRRARTCDLASAACAVCGPVAPIAAGGRVRRRHRCSAVHGPALRSGLSTRMHRQMVQ